MRHSSSARPTFGAGTWKFRVNAGDGTHEHPSQGLLDALDHPRPQRHVENLNVTILGDISHSGWLAPISPAGKIRLPLHALRTRHVGSARTGEDRAAGNAHPLRLPRREALEDADVYYRPPRANRALARAVSRAKRLHSALPAQRITHAPGQEDALILHPGPSPRHRDYSEWPMGTLRRTRTSDQRCVSAHGHSLSTDGGARKDASRAGSKGETKPKESALCF